MRAALVQWGEGALNPGASIRMFRSTAYVDHGFAWLELKGRRLIIDGDGVQDETGLRQKLIKLKGVRPIDVRFSKGRELVVGIPQDRWASDRLAQLLSRRFGRFRLELITRR